jgi:hypothetical protein
LQREVIIARAKISHTAYGRRAWLFWDSVDYAMLKEALFNRN